MAKRTPCASRRVRGKTDREPAPTLSSRSTRQRREKLARPVARALIPSGSSKHLLCSKTAQGNVFFGGCSGIVSIHNERMRVEMPLKRIDIAYMRGEIEQDSGMATTISGDVSVRVSIKRPQVGGVGSTHPRDSCLP